MKISQSKFIAFMAKHQGQICNSLSTGETKWAISTHQRKWIGLHV